MLRFYIPRSTCFVALCTILLPLVPLCSVWREPKALEKSKPDWRRYVIYSVRGNGTESVGHPSDFTQCILIAGLTLRYWWLVSKINPSKIDLAKVARRKEAETYSGFLMTVYSTIFILFFLFSTLSTIFHIFYFSASLVSAFSSFFTKIFPFLSVRDVFSLKCSELYRNHRFIPISRE